MYTIKLMKPKKRKSLIKKLLNNKNLNNVDYFNYWYHNIDNNKEKEILTNEIIIKYYIWLSKGLKEITIKALMKVNPNMDNMYEIILCDWIKRRCNV